MKKLFVTILTGAILPFTLSAQDIADDPAFSHVTVGIQASPTMGAGIVVGTNLTPNLKLRAGVSYLGFNLGNHTLDLEDDDAKTLEGAFGYTPSYKVDGDIKFLNGQALVDYYPMKNGVFHLTAGVYIGNNKISGKGNMVDKDGKQAELLPGKTWPTIDFGGYVLDTNGGKLDAAFELGGVIKPYFGLGLGRTIPNSRLGFNFDLGFMYQGKYSITQNGKDLPSAVGDLTGGFTDLKDAEKYLKWWPQLNFQLTYRIF